MKDVHLKDLKEFITWAMKQNAKTRFILNDRFNHSFDRYEYRLDVAGTGSKWRPMQSIHIPREVGEPLAEVWKKNDYRRFVGMRNIKSILKIVEVSDAVIAEYEATRLAVKDQQRRQRTYNRADYSLDRIKAIQRELGQLNETLDELDMHSANLTILGLEDTRLRLVGLMEVTNV